MRNAREKRESRARQGNNGNPFDLSILRCSVLSAGGMNRENEKEMAVADYSGETVRIFQVANAVRCVAGYARDVNSASTLLSAPVRKTATSKRVP